MTAIMNVGSSIFPTIGSYIHDETLHMADGMKGFRYVGDILLFQQAAFWALLSFLGLLTAIWLLIMDKRKENGVLSKRDMTQKVDDVISSQQAAEIRSRFGTEYATDLGKG